jgi:hypothetical protein
MSQSDAILNFYRNLRPRFALGDGIGIMNPYKEAAAWAVVQQFYKKYYSDNRPRAFIFGINPGRHGAGMTGIPFTDPVRLTEICGIPNGWKQQAELSSQFVYAVIDACGGAEAFYRRYHITGLSPLFEPFMLRCIRRQLATMPNFSTCFCLGEGENYKYFSRINDRHGFFKEIIPLPHPRWVMQYRRKKVKEYTELYVEKLRINLL